MSEESNHSNSSDKTEVSSFFDATGRDRTSLRAWKSMVEELYDFRELTRRLVSRNFAGKFRQSFLGYIWIALPPLATAVVFTMLKKANIVSVNMGDIVMPYAIFSLMGITFWQFFQQVTMMGTQSVFHAGMLVSKIYFPREILVLSAVGDAVVNLIIRLAVMIAVFIVLGYVPHWEILFGVLLLFPILALGIGLSFFLAPINTMMNDMGRMLEFTFQFGMFLAPTIYPTPSLDNISSKYELILYWLHNINPVSHFMHGVVSLSSTGTIDNALALIVSTLISMLTLLTGWRFFHICEPLLAERI